MAILDLRLLLGLLILLRDSGKLYSKLCSSLAPRLQVKSLDTFFRI